MVLNVAIVATVLITALLLWRPKVHAWTLWRAMTTPLASIIGSGFLVLGPLLDASYGMYAPLVMAALCMVAYLFGSAIRFSMSATENGDTPTAVSALETASSWALAFAYVISVAYYLNLLGSFAVSLSPVDDPYHARLVTTAVLLIVLFVGWTRGFKSLEMLEYVSVSVKLAIIAGLLLAMGVYFTGKVANGTLIFTPPEVTGWQALTLGFGLIVTVQGFETSRYLGRTYSLKVRLKSMRWAQFLSAMIYMAYILLIAFVFERGQLETSETAIIDLMGIVAPILPTLLVAAAIAAQFSAAVADTGGAGGLVAEESRNRISPRVAYAILIAAGIALTWAANIFEIIAYASRAFALYYATQSAIACLYAIRDQKRAQIALFASLTLLGALIVIFGQPIES